MDFISLRFLIPHPLVNSSHEFLPSPLASFVPLPLLLLLYPILQTPFVIVPPLPTSSHEILPSPRFPVLFPCRFSSFSVPFYRLRLLLFLLYPPAATSFSLPRLPVLFPCHFSSFSVPFYSLRLLLFPLCLPAPPVPPLPASQTHFLLHACYSLLTQFLFLPFNTFSFSSNSFPISIFCSPTAHNIIKDIQLHRYTDVLQA